MPFEMWVWCLPGADGQICAEFSIQYPAIVIPSIVTWNEPMIAVSLGDLPGGLGVCYKECQHEWNWICHQTCYLTSTDPAEIKIAAHPEAGVYQFANCSPGYPIEPVHLLTHLILNYSSG